MNGRPDCWVVYSEITGRNGGGDYWINKHWTLQSTGTIHHTDIRSLSWEGSRDLERRIRSFMESKAA